YDKTKQFSVKYAYKLISHHDQQRNFSNHYSNLIWKSKVPLKVITFVWRPFQDRIPTKNVLLKRGVLLNNNGGSFCAFYNEFSESTNHLFSSCKFTYSVWQHLHKWLNIIVALPLTPLKHFTYHFGMVKNARNDLVFNNVIPSITSILDSTKMKSWLWIKTQAGMKTIDYASWTSNSLGCINIIM
ncbi:hypothetical protein Lal_00025902, partial [Lupinus albus]